METIIYVVLFVYCTTVNNCVVWRLMSTTLHPWSQTQPPNRDSGRFSQTTVMSCSSSHRTPRYAAVISHKRLASPNARRKRSSPTWYRQDTSNESVEEEETSTVSTSHYPCDITTRRATRSANSSSFSEDHKSQDPNQPWQRSCTPGVEAPGG
jgi:hypothetical protein